MQELLMNVSRGLRATAVSKAHPTERPSAKTADES